MAKAGGKDMVSSLKILESEQKRLDNVEVACGDTVILHFIIIIIIILAS
jgi:hypothetical protein